MNSKTRISSWPYQHETTISEPRALSVQERLNHLSFSAWWSTQILFEEEHLKTDPKKTGSEHWNQPRCELQQGLVNGRHERHLERGKQLRSKRDWGIQDQPKCFLAARGQSCRRWAWTWGAWVFQKFFDKHTRQLPCSLQAEQLNQKLEVILITRFIEVRKIVHFLRILFFWSVERRGIGTHCWVLQFDPEQCLLRFSQLLWLCSHISAWVRLYWPLHQWFSIRKVLAWTAWAAAWTVVNNRLLERFRPEMILVQSHIPHIVARPRAVLRHRAAWAPRFRFEVVQKLKALFVLWSNNG